MFSRYAAAAAAISLSLGCRDDRAMFTAVELAREASAVVGRSLVTSDQIGELLAELPPVQWFGVALAGKKIGHATLALRRAGDQVSVASTLVVSRRGSGALELTEERIYAATPPYRLESVIASERGADGASEIHVARRASAMERRKTVDGVLVSAGGIPRSQETLADAVSQSFAQPRWLTVGARAEIVELDIDAGVDRKTIATVANVGETRLAGISAAMADVVLRRDGEAETRTRLGGLGMVIEATVGAFAFVAQDERTAKLDVVGLDLAAAKIDVARRLGDATKLRSIEFVLRARTEGAALSVPETASQTHGQAESGLGLTVRVGAGDRVSAEERRLALLTSDAFDFDKPELGEVARRVAPASMPRRLAIAALNAYVYEHLEKKLATDLGSASSVLKKGVGDCTEHTLLFVALARAVGIAAREVSGLLYLGDAAGAFGWHAWAEVELDGAWWAVDPSWGEFPANPSHITLGIGDDSRWITLIGGLDLEILAVDAI